MKTQGKADLRLLDMIKLALAQFHGSEVGIEKHFSDLRERGENTDRLKELRNWPSSILFTRKERFALSLAEAVTVCPEGAVTKILLDEASAYFTRSELVDLIMEIQAINDWNDGPGQALAEVKGPKFGYPKMRDAIHRDGFWEAS